MKFKLFHILLLITITSLLAQCITAKDSKSKINTTQPVLTGTPPEKETQYTINTWCFSDSAFSNEIEVYSVKLYPDSLRKNDSMQLPNRIRSEFAITECIKYDSEIKHTFYIKISKIESGLLDNFLFLKGSHCNTEIEKQLLKIVKGYPLVFKDDTIKIFYLKLLIVVDED